MVLYVNIALAYCKLERWTPVFFCYKIWLFSIQSYLRCSSVWYPPHTRVKKSKRKSLTKYTDLAQSNSRYFTSYYMQYLCLPCLPIVCGDFTTTFRNPYGWNIIFAWIFWEETTEFVYFSIFLHYFGEFFFVRIV